MTEAPLTVNSLLAQAQDADQRSDLRVLLSATLQQSFAWLYTHGDHVPDAALLQRFHQLWQARLAGQPVAYLLGQREFHGLPFLTSPAALIPRSDTEVLVDALLERLSATQALHVLDLGTGTGAIGLTLAVRRPVWRITLTDRSPAALALATRNAQALGVADRVRLLSGDWLRALPAGERFDAIASNPPYIADADPHLQQGDLRFEPAEALRAGPDGLADLQALAAGAPAHLRPGAWLALEHGHDQGPAVRSLLTASGLADVQTLRDLAGHERVGLGRAAH